MRKTDNRTDGKSQAQIQPVNTADTISTQLSDLHLDKDPILSVTALIHHVRLTEPICLWDSSSPENAESVTAVMAKIEEYGLMQRCKLLEGRLATNEELLMVHSPEYIDRIKSTEKMTTEELHTLSDSYDLVYFHPKSYTACCLAVGCILQLVDEIMGSKVRNGMAVVRPPGHNAHRDSASAYCIFNNLAIAAGYSIKKHGVERVMIIDWDIFHGQGTQYIFEDDPRVLYFSIHRYEHGDFWPHLPESDCTTDGSGQGSGFNINVPWNKTMMSDADYLAVFHQLLLPIAHEYRPNLILVAAGFNSVLGDPQGGMAATPACFAQLTHMLMPLAEGKLLLSLEGGFNPRSMADGACACLKVLLGDPCPQLEPTLSPSESAMESIGAVITVHRKYWMCLRKHEASSFPEQPQNVHEEEPEIAVEETLDRTMAEVLRPLPAHETGLLYDERMKQHYNMWDLQHPEQPDRISQIFSRHQELRLVEKCLSIPAEPTTERVLRLCHGAAYIASMKATKDLKPRDLHRKSSEYNSIYIAPRSYDCALLAVGSVCNVVKAVLDRQVRNAVAIVRPPGHHADRDKACGFCLFNNVALAARFAQQQVGHKMRVLILDWDIHHGNGTQLIFEDDPSVLYISIHRYDNGTFFPNTHDGDYIKVGKGKGEGFNVNIAWNEGRMGDSEYMAAFHRVVMPIAYQYRPELVLVSAGFDSARGDPLGGCDVTPECFAHLTHMLQGLAGGRVVLVLEGGYNLSSISESMAMCTRTLLGDTPPSLEPLRVMINSAIDSINNVIKTHSQYWTCLRIHIPEQESQVQAIVTPMSAWPMQQAPEVALVDAIAKATSARRNSFWLPSQFTGVVNKGQDLLKHSLQPQDSPASIPEGRRVNTRSPLLQQQYLSVEEMVSGAEPARARVAGPRPGSRGGARPKVKMPTDSAAEAGPPRIASETDAERSETTQSEITFKRPEEDILRRGSSSDVSHSPSSTSRLQTDSDDDLRNVGSACHRSRCAEPDVPLPDLTLPADEPGTVYAVAPLLWCPHLEMVRPAADYDLDLDLPCEECGSVTENWLCLTCFQVHCGRYVNEHMVLHAMNYNHLVVLSFSDLSAWCYGCDSYIHNQVLSSAQEEVYRLKFGEESEEST